MSICGRPNVDVRCHPPARPNVACSVHFLEGLPPAAPPHPPRGPASVPPRPRRSTPLTPLSRCTLVVRRRSVPKCHSMSDRHPNVEVHVSTLLEEPRQDLSRRTPSTTFGSWRDALLAPQLDRLPRARHKSTRSKAAMDALACHARLKLSHDVTTNRLESRNCLVVCR
jgi:hypothetical protein